MSFTDCRSQPRGRIVTQAAGHVKVLARPKKNAAETEREKGKQFVALRHQHSAVESEINSLEHQGLNRCLDVGRPGYLRYVGLGVLSYNLHVIGRELLARQRAESASVCLTA